MTNPSPHPHSYSPPRSAFQWPAPLSPRLKHQKHNLTTATNTDLPLKDILETYKNDSGILRYILLAKAEEDKRQAARDMLKTEQARIQLRQLDLEYLREQSKSTRYYDKTYQQTHASTGPPFDKPAITGTSLPPPSSLAPSYVYGLAPVQQQVLARITGNHSDTHHLSTYSNHYEYQPSSPVAYPHSAHPLCPPTDLRIKGTSSSSAAAPILTTSTTYPRYNVSTSTPLISTAGAASQHHRHRLQPPSINTSTSSNPAQNSTPISPSIGNNNNNNDDTSTSATTRYKRTRHSVSDQLDDKLSHNKVMEALKAKIQRGNGSPVSTTPTSALPYRPSFVDTFHMDKRQRQLPKPIVTLNNGSSASASSTSHNDTSSTPTTTVHTASPRSAKPILPPIDTSVGRQHHHHQPQHRSSSPVQISPTTVETTPAPAGTPSTSQVSPSDQLLAMSTHRQERNASHSTSTSTSSSLSTSSSSSSSNGTHGHDPTTTTAATTTKIKLEMD